MPRAFFKTVAGVKRWRIATVGRDANDLGLDPNYVVFDSAFSNTWSVYDSGVFTVQSAPADGAKIRAWPTLTYTPIFLMNGNSGNTAVNQFDAVILSRSTGPLALINAKSDGLYIYNPSIFNYPLNIWYVVFRASI